MGAAEQRPRPPAPHPAPPAPLGGCYGIPRHVISPDRSGSALGSSPGWTSHTSQRPPLQVPDPPYWAFSMWRTRGSNQSPYWMAELLAPKESQVVTEESHIGRLYLQPQSFMRKRIRPEVMESPLIPDTSITHLYVRLTSTAPPPFGIRVCVTSEVRKCSLM